MRTEASIRGEKHYGARDQAWAIRKKGTITLQLAEPPYSVNNGPIFQTKSI